MKITCISDLHGHYPKLEGGDLLLIAGDLTKSDKGHEYYQFKEWLWEQKYSKKVVIGGNHDTLIANGRWKFDTPEGFDYLCDSGTEFDGLKIWGTPWVKSFPGMNPHCMAFTLDTEDELQEKWDLIPTDVDILVTHSPPYGILDKTCCGKYAGSTSLVVTIGAFKHPPKLWVWGHIHEAYGPIRQKPCKMINASHVNRWYQPVNKPIQVILEI